MNIIEELIHDLSQANPNISDALLKTKILLFKLGQKDLAGWVNHELNGYPSDTAVPDYRVTQGVLKGVITNGYWTYNDQVLPTSHLPDALRDRFERRIELREPISVLQEIGGHGKAIHFQVPIEINHLIGEALDDGAWVLQSNCQLGLGVPTRVTTQIRSRLIDFLLELREEFGDDATNAEIVSMAKDKNIESAFNSAIFGDNTTIVIGDGNRFNVKNAVLKERL